MRALLGVAASVTLAGCSDSTAPGNSWPGGGQLIVFVSTRDGNNEIYSMHPDGTDLKRLTDSPAIDYMPQLSPDGTRIAFTSDRDGDYQVYVMNVDGTNVHRVSAAGAVSSGSPSWSPDGRHIAYDADDGGSQTIWTTDADGSNQHYLNVPGYFAVWGPDAIAFDRSSGGHSQIFLMDPDGGNVRQISQDTLNDYADGWSPDGKKIVFEAGDELNGAPVRIFTCDADGTNRVPFADGQPDAEDAAASWSPDGSRLIFESTRGGTKLDLYTARNDGTDVERLTNGPGANAMPSWR
jgi:Tol biopolymer transport system component